MSNGIQSVTATNIFQKRFKRNNNHQMAKSDLNQLFGDKLKANKDFTPDEGQLQKIKNILVKRINYEGIKGRHSY